MPGTGWPATPVHGRAIPRQRSGWKICCRCFPSAFAASAARRRCNWFRRGARLRNIRLKLRQRMGLGEEKLIHPARDEASVMLPPVLDLMPEQSLNLDLYVWLAPLHGRDAASTNHRDRSSQGRSHLLDAASALEAQVLKAFPGLADRYRRSAAPFSERAPRLAAPGGGAAGGPHHRSSAPWRGACPALGRG